MPKRPCLRCSRPTTRAYCGACVPNPAPRNRSHAEADRRRAAVQAHVAEFGWRCLGDADHEAHATTDLTADHVVPRVEGGENGPLVVRCRSSNSRRGDAPRTIGV